MKAVVLLLVLALAFVAAQPPRPQISEVFEGEGYTHVVTAHGDVWGLGRWIIDQPTGKSLEAWTFPQEHRHHNVHFLRRFDLGFDYALEFEAHPSPHIACRKHAVTPPMHPTWEWVKEARFHGKRDIDGTTYNVWGHHFGGVDLEVAVSEHDASRPHYFVRRSASDHRVYHLISFNTFKPNQTWFDVPAVCKNTTFTDVSSAVDGNDALIGTCGVAAAHAENLVAIAPQTSAQELIVAAFNKAGIAVPASIEGKECADGVRFGDVFTDGTSAAVYLGNDRFAECGRGACSIVGWRPFSGMCRRFC